ncbi:hypothetical protein JCM10207_005883 [Rhodosporidiobolus poonsookiae]
MPLLPRLLALCAALLAVLYALLRPRLALLGLTTTPQPALNLDTCERIEGLEACGSAWVDQGSGVAYLPCSSVPARASWFPPLSRLSAPASPTQPDTLRVLDLQTRNHREIKLVGMPAQEGGAGRVWVDGISGAVGGNDGGEEGEEVVTLYLVSHRPPSPPSSAPTVGADSVIEVFRTQLGSDEARWVRTVRHALVRTPGGVLADGERGVWVTNDHAGKTDWTRKLEPWYHAPSEIVYCDLTSPLDRDVECVIAADGLKAPSGLAKGPGDLLYSASAFSGEVTVWEIQHADKSLVPLDIIPLPHPISALHISPTGALFAATSASFFSSGNATAANPALPLPRMSRSPVEVWSVQNETGAAQYYGQKYATLLALSDPTGEVVSGITTAAPWREWLLLTGYFTPDAVMCRLDETPESHETRDDISCHEPHQLRPDAAGQASKAV